jgi:hypothetical protein
MFEAPTLVIFVTCLVISLVMGALSCAREYKRLRDKFYTWLMWSISFVSGLFCMLSLERLVYGAEPLVEDPSIHLAVLYLASALLTLLGIVVGENLYKRLRKAKVA